MPNGNDLLSTRKQIAKDYCRSILWLDDEIRPHAGDSVGRAPYLTFFHPITEEFHKEGILCQLKGFSQTQGEDDPFKPEIDEIGICKNLAKMADILILDWYLGASDPSHSIKILDGLIEAGGTRFIIILSQEAKLVEEFENHYGEIFKKSDTAWYRSEKGQFVCLLAKDSFKPGGTAAALMEKIYNELASVYPDYLHWTALEVASKIKAFTPQWLASLPMDTDLAVLAEKVHAFESIGNSMLENLLEDLKEAVEAPSLKSISQDSLNPAYWPKAAEYQTVLDRDKATITNNTSLLARINNFVPIGNASIQRLNINDSRTAKNVFKDGSQLESIKRLKDSVDSLGQFSEVVSHSDHTGTATRRGSVFKKSGSGGNANILVCVSQACDCLRADSLLFLTGAEVLSGYDGKIGETFVQFQKKTYVFKTEAQSLTTPALSSAMRWPEDHEHVGILREVAVSRLISRFWGQTTRIGIDQPRFLRELRIERD
jgi:hypothetical protein